jgi:hypothetical protein
LEAETMCRTCSSSTRRCLRMLELWTWTMKAGLRM